MSKSTGEIKHDCILHTCADVHINTYTYGRHLLSDSFLDWQKYLVPCFLCVEAKNTTDSIESAAHIFSMHTSKDLERLAHQDKVLETGTICFTNSLQVRASHQNPQHLKIAETPPSCIRCWEDESV